MLKRSYMKRSSKPMKRTPLARKSTRVKSKTTKKYLKKVAKTWKRKAWDKFSELIRRQADGKCFTCPAVNRWQDCDAGHFRHDRLDFDVRNIHCQCQKCNRFLHGNLGNYALALMQEIGIEGVNQLNRDATLELGLPKKSAEDYKALYDTFVEALKHYE